MICTNCNTPNEADNVFCVNCGNAVTARPGASMPTIPLSQSYVSSDSTETSVVNFGQAPGPMPSYTPNPPYLGENKAKKTNPVVWIGVGLVAVIGLIAVGALFFLSAAGGGEVFPEHLGMFVQSATKDRNDEISKQDFSKVIEAKDSFMKNDNLATLDPQPNLILYADGKDIPVNDLRLIQLDTIKDDGTMKQLDFQAALVDGKPAMKRLRVPEALANGKYAFALLDGFFNDGKHKFWAFQVKNSSKSENGDALKASSFPLKSGTSAQPPTQTNLPRASVPAPVRIPVEPPAGARVAYTKTGNVLIRATPSLSGPVRGKIGGGQQVFVFGFTGYDCFKGQCGQWAQIQTTSGASGYILSVLLR